MAITRQLPNFSFTDNSVTGRFDASLFIPDGNNNPNDTSANAQLIITLKIHLQQDNTGSGRTLAAPHAFAAWPAAEWAAFQSRFAAGANFWKNRFWLVLDLSKVNSPEYRAIEREMALLNPTFPHWLSGDMQRLVYRRNIKCNFNLQLVSDAGGAHKVLHCQYIVDAAGNPISGPAAPYVHRSDDSNVDVGDTYPDAGGFNCVAHEVGHMLGLAHIGVVTANPACIAVVTTPTGGNSDACYNGTTSTYTNNIMGHGGLLDYRQALPWRKAFETMSGVPLTHYIVQQIQYTPGGGGLPELITEHTPRWQDFYSSMSWWPVW